MERMHLLCNAHLDPYWLWEWEEGAAEALSTFRSAADLLEEYDAVVFNHNEVILYKWIEEYEPALFERIQRLVKEGRWHIMGGWYLQPDCNMPSGESFIRQALSGREYFREKFGVEPTTAINFDPFGHTRGLVQILAKSGYDSYLFMRPDNHYCPLEDANFVWVGYDGSEVLASRFLRGYNTPLGGARDRMEDYLTNEAGRTLVIAPWGVGNHGGGPSRRDLEDLKSLFEETKDVELIHSTAEQYFADVRETLGDNLPRREKDINLWAPGCYTSQVRIKQKHRKLENELYAIEKMAAGADLQGLMPYAKEAFHEALCDLMVAEFHDILPGSSIQPCEEAALRLIDHGLELLARKKAHLFFTYAQGQPKAEEGTIPVFAYNPHPWPVKGTFMCEFNLPDANFGEVFTLPVAHRDGKALPTQIEREYCSVESDWRKRVVFEAELAPMQMSRFDCTYDVQEKKRPAPAVQAENGRFTFKTDRLEVIIDAESGLMDRYAVDGVNYLAEDAFVPLIIDDNADAWSMIADRFHDLKGRCAPLPPKKAARVAGIAAEVLDPVRVIEDGPVRTVIQALLGWGDSVVVLTYRLPKQGTEAEVHVRVHWAEKDTMLKLAVPPAFDDGTYWGQVACGRDQLPGETVECVAQKWTAAVSQGSDAAVTLINSGTYGSDYYEGAIRMTLLRSPAYSGHPVHDRPIVPQDRYTPRIDQGEREFTFWLNAGPKEERLKAIGREALERNEAPMLLSFYPSGQGETPKPGLTLSDDAVVLTAFKQAEDGNGCIIRLFEPTGQPRETKVAIPPLGMEEEVALAPFEIKTFRLDPDAKRLIETNLMEKPLV